MTLLLVLDVEGRCFSAARYIGSLSLQDDASRLDPRQTVHYPDCRRWTFSIFFRPKEIVCATMMPWGFIQNIVTWISGLFYFGNEHFAIFFLQDSLTVNDAVWKRLQVDLCSRLRLETFLPHVSQSPHFLAALELKTKRPINPSVKLEFKQIDIFLQQSWSLAVIMRIRSPGRDSSQEIVQHKLHISLLHDHLF